MMDDLLLSTYFSRATLEVPSRIPRVLRIRHRLPPAPMQTATGYTRGHLVAYSPIRY